MTDYRELQFQLSIGQLTIKLQELMDENERLRKDAERYRWLKQRAKNRSAYISTIEIPILGDIDATIDEAMKDA